MGSIDRMRPEEWILGLRELCERFVAPGSVVVEIGCFAGESTALFAERAKRVFAIDPWPESYASDIVSGCSNPRVRQVVQQLGVTDMREVEALFDRRAGSLANVTKMKARDEEVVHRFEAASVDLVYIDSIHTYDVVRGAIQRWHGKVRPDGVCAGHDYLESDWPGVVAAVNEAFGRPPYLFRDTSWAIRKSESPLRIASPRESG
jgi:SAM-dependent methyltransferase